MKEEGSDRESVTAGTVHKAISDYLARNDHPEALSPSARRGFNVCSYFRDSIGVFAGGSVTTDDVFRALQEKSIPCEVLSGSVVRVPLESHFGKKD
jgi:hypothetical protein